MNWQWIIILQYLLLMLNTSHSRSDTGLLLTNLFSFFSGGDFMSHPVHTTSPALIAAASVCVCVRCWLQTERKAVRILCSTPPNTERRNSQHRPGTEWERKNERERRNKQRVGGERVCFCICMWSVRGHVCTSKPSVCVFWVEEEKMFLPPVSCNKPAHDLVCVCVCVYVKTQGQFGKCCEGNFNRFTRPSVVRASEKERGEEGDRKWKRNYFCSF